MIKKQTNKQTTICGVCSHFRGLFNWSGSATVARDVWWRLFPGMAAVLSTETVGKLFRFWGNYCFNLNHLCLQNHCRRISSRLRLILSHPPLTWPPSPYFHFPVVVDSDLELQSCCLSASKPRSVTDCWRLELPPLQPTYERKSNWFNKTAKTICYCWRRRRAITNPVG